MLEYTLHANCLFKWLLHSLVSSEGIAPLGDNRAKTLKRVKAPSLSGFQRHELKVTVTSGRS
eukprot:1463110-Pyramimonas_sp.AAC.1